MTQPATLFATTLFASAALLFCVQPMVGRLLLPVLGGSPQVWNTCLVFFQAALLGGYLFAHGLATRLPLRAQAVVHIALLVAAAVSLPIALGADVAVSDNHVVWTLTRLAAMVGLPFVALAANGPLLQSWYARTDADDASDPYFLYAASNVGSFVGLLGYPLLAEPLLGTRDQAVGWAWLYGVLVVFIAATAWLTSRRAVQRDPTVATDADDADNAPSARRQLRWLLLAAIPSSLLLGVTTFLTTDLAAIPLLWVVPLALYLLTWVETFARRRRIPAPFVARALPILVVAWLLLRVTEATEPAWALVLFHLLTFLAAALLCHGQLADDRPPPAHLTRFFLLTSLGGVLGGAFNALFAPVVFADLWEYPLAILAACLVLPGVALSSWRDLVGPAAVALAAGGLLFGADAMGLPPGPTRSILAFGLPALGAWLLVDRPLRFALAVAAILAVATQAPSVRGNVQRTERSFFGVQRVTTDARGRFDQIVHGHTLHGRQWREGPRRCEPLAYYHPTGPLGDIVKLRGESKMSATAMIGLGAGAMLSYRSARMDWLVVDIDPATWLLADESFGFVHGCPADPKARKLRRVVADGRIAMATSDETFDTIVVDVFSSDAIPVHMLTREAFDVYLQRLRPGGVIAFHASNRYLDVVSVLAAVARDRGLAVLARDDKRTRNNAPGAEPSRWVVVARENVTIDALRAHHWRDPSPHPTVWTDDFNDLPILLLGGLFSGS